MHSHQLRLNFNRQTLNCLKKQIMFSVTYIKKIFQQVPSEVACSIGLMLLFAYCYQKWTVCPKMIILNTVLPEIPSLKFVVMGNAKILIVATLN